MSSTYVEVREAENGVGELGFQLNDCETNGIDIQSHYNAFPAKDHTYNKDPSFVDEDFLNKKSTSEAKNNENEVPKRIVRAHRNVKHKIIKPRHEDNVIKTENENIKKTPSKTIGVKDPVPEPSEPLVTNENKTTGENNENSSISEVITPKRSNRKRKVEEETNKQNVKTIEKKLKSPKNRKSQVNSKKENEYPGESSLEKEASPLKKSKSEGVKTSKTEKTPETKNTRKQVDVTPKEKTKPVKDEEDVESQGLPSGWIRKVVERKSGKTAGLCDIYIYSPEGIKFRSRPDVAAYLLKTKSKLRIEDFSFKRASFQSPLPSFEKKSPKVVVKETKKEKEKVPSGSSKKKVAKLKVKIATPRKSVNKTPKSDGESQAASSESRRTGARKRILKQ